LRSLKDTKNGELMEEMENIFEVKIPTRVSRNTKIRISAYNHLLALKRAVKILRPDLSALEVKAESGRWELLSLEGKPLGYIRKIKN